MDNKTSAYHQAILGKTGDIFYLHGTNDYREVAIQMVDQATRTLELFTPDLEPLIYDHTDFISPLKQLALQSRVARIRILLQDNNLIRTQGHRLINLAQRLTSTIEVRKPDREYRQFPESFLLVDECAYLHRKLSSQYEATACFNDRLAASRLEEIFIEAWEAGEPDMELLRLHL